jgi:dTDP-4-dehydrorhamnose 3,5-epimerase
MKVIDTAISEVKIIETRVFGDERGFFQETWNSYTFKELGLDLTFVQDNHSRSSKGTLRGLHYQIQNPQGKLVRVTHGKVIDVAVDMRQSSPTFGRHIAVELSGENKRLLWVPPGFAHGFHVLSESADFLYKCTDGYHPQHERSLLWNDPALGIDWQLLPGSMPILSSKDAEGIPFAEADHFA